MRKFSALARKSEDEKKNLPITKLSLCVAAKTKHFIHEFNTAAHRFKLILHPTVRREGEVVFGKIETLG